jgi:hypothetical protein
MQGTTLFPRMAGIVPQRGKGGSCVFCKEAETVTTNGKMNYLVARTTSTLNNMNAEEKQSHFAAIASMNRRRLRRE